MAINDIYTDGIAGGWDVQDASRYTEDLRLEADVIVIGSGAGGGTAAEILTLAGLKVLIVEEGPLKTSANFRDMDEARALAELYQDGGSRSTSDGTVAVLQGRSVGGTTTVNWTSSFRTPPQTLDYWSARFGVRDASEAAMQPWFEKMEARLGIAPWKQAPNANNAVLARGAEKLGWEAHVIPRNVRGCWDTGYCGYGCPVNAKQSMLVSTLPAALARGATLIHRLRVERVLHQGDQVQELQALALGADARTPTGIKVRLRARHYVLAGGALNNPALLLRSAAPDPHQRLGLRTCIHPVNMTLAQMPERIDGYYGAPQSIASDEFQWRADDERIPGYKIEVPPMAPALSSTIFGVHGQALAAAMRELPHTNAMLALLRDGFHPESEGGRVRIDEYGNPLLDYSFSDYLWRGFRDAYLRMAELQFAAGARAVMPAHLDGRWAASWDEVRTQIENLPYRPFRLALFTAHLMGGCGMGEDPRQSVVNSDGRHHQLANLSIMDGSIFPSSIGANPQLSIYGRVARNASLLAQGLQRV